MYAALCGDAHNPIAVEMARGAHELTNIDDIAKTSAMMPARVSNVKYFQIPATLASTRGMTSSTPSRCLMGAPQPRKTGYRRSWACAARTAGTQKSSGTAPTSSELLCMAHTSTDFFRRSTFS